MQISLQEYLKTCFKADLEGTTFAYDCRMRFLEHTDAARVMPIPTIVVGF